MPQVRLVKFHGIAFNKQPERFALDKCIGLKYKINIFDGIRFL